MTKHEFLDQLRRTLARELDDGEVADHVRYYNEYIDNAARQGKSEEQVLSELGDPRMIAKTILDVDVRREESPSSWQDSTVYTESGDGTYQAEEDYGSGDPRGFDGYWSDRGEADTGRGGFQMFLSGWKAWLAVAVVLVILFAVLGTVFVIFWKLLPFILAGWAAVSVYRWVTRR